MNLFYEYNRRFDYLFCLIMIISLFILLVRLITSNGNVWNEIFQNKDLIDSGMDFFNSIVCTQYGEPYKVFKTLYPPMANAFFYICYLCIPESISNNWIVSYQNFNATRCTNLDLRVWQASFMIYFLYAKVIIITSYFIIKHSIMSKNALVSVMLLFTTGMLFAEERGNIIILVLSLVFLFLFLHKSDNKLKKELGIIALAFAVSLKIYPILYGVILIANRDIKGTIKLFIYSCALFFIPFYILFNGTTDLLIWINIAVDVGTGKNMAIGHEYVGLLQFTVASLDSSLLKEICFIQNNKELILKIIKCFTMWLIISMIIAALINKLEWKRLLAISLIISLAQGHSPLYTTIFLIPAFVSFLNKNNTVINKFNFGIFLLFSIILVPWPCFGNLRFAICMREFALICLALIILSDLFKKNTWIKLSERRIL